MQNRSVTSLTMKNHVPAGPSPSSAPPSAAPEKYSPPGLPPPQPPRPPSRQAQLPPIFFAQPLAAPRHQQQQQQGMVWLLSHSQLIYAFGAMQAAIAWISGQSQHCCNATSRAFLRSAYRRRLTPESLLLCNRCMRTCWTSCCCMQWSAWNSGHTPRRSPPSHTACRPPRSLAPRPSRPPC